MFLFIQKRFRHRFIYNFHINDINIFNRAKRNLFVLLTMIIHLRRHDCACVYDNIFILIILKNPHYKKTIVMFIRVTM